MNAEASIRGFIAAVIFGAGFRLGWGLVGLVFDMLARAAGH